MVSTWFSLILWRSFTDACISTTDLLRSITDPEHPVSLEALRVVNPEDITVAGNRVLVYLTPTIPHCSMSTLIGELRVLFSRKYCPLCLFLSALEAMRCDRNAPAPL